MTTPLRLVVFDVDGTLVDSQNHIMAAMQVAFGDLGLVTPPRAAVLGIVGLSLPEAMRRLAPEAPRDLIEGLTAGYRGAFAARRAQAESPLYPGARAVLQALAGQDSVLLGVATGKSRRGLDHMLRTHELGDYFVTAQVADDHPSKPHPSMLEAALRETGVAPGNAVMVGDTSYDMEMARNAGLPGIGVAWGYHAAAALHRAGAARVIEDFSALGPALAALQEAAA
ncbi:HAD-IA family hydrolase [Alkalilacustris brevis]|uniref:HAD-IA family hydrolase n=1 Tax=Alkalilacustris brevis TaxID=2026338 RepID=UPI000E0CDEBC|nr:HAD-IA family hydrolase [Alkalilacustris brevis]